MVKMGRIHTERPRCRAEALRGKLRDGAFQKFHEAAAEAHFEVWYSIGRHLNGALWHATVGKGRIG